MNRILEPDNFEKGKNINSTNDISNLACKCDNLIAVPIKHTDGRYALRLIQGTFYKSKYNDFRK